MPQALASLTNTTVTTPPRPQRIAERVRHLVGSWGVAQLLATRDGLVLLDLQSSHVDVRGHTRRDHSFAAVPVPVARELAAGLLAVCADAEASRR